MVDYGCHDMVALECEHPGTEEVPINYRTGGRYMISPPHGNSIDAVVLAVHRGDIHGTMITT